MDLKLLELRESAKTQNVQNIKENLETIIAQGANIELTDTDTFEILLCSEDENILTLTAESIAELAKSPRNRELMTRNEIIEPLLRLCKTIQNEKYFQCFRAVGNICYENDDARKIVGLAGVQILVEKIDSTVDNVVWHTNRKVPSMLCGCLLNVLMSNDDLQKASLSCNILKTIEKLLVKLCKVFEHQEDCITYVLQILSVIIDHVLDQCITENLCSLLVDILRVSENPEISVLCLEILRVQSEHDDVKLCLAKQGTCELVYELVEKYGGQADDEDSRSVLKMACDLIVLILTGDASMILLYNNGNGTVFKQMISWIDSDDSDLLSTGVLAIGNFARNDTHCIYMVNSGLSKKLLDVLSNSNTRDGDIKLQHALLSALRHLSIPTQNKSILIEDNIIEILYNMIYIDYSPVIFKLMGTFRMLIDGQESTALNLICRKEFIEQIAHWYYNTDHLGVHSEAPRLLAWLIKNCRSLKPIPFIISVPDSVKCLVEMISSTHTVMQNEALLALNLICSYCSNKHNDRTADDIVTGNVDKLINKINLDNELNYDTNSYVGIFIGADVGKNVTFIINKYYEKMEKEMISNLLVLLGQLTKSTDIAEHLRKSNLGGALLLLSKNKNMFGFSEKFNSLLSVYK